MKTISPVILMLEELSYVALTACKEAHGIEALATEGHELHCVHARQRIRTDHALKLLREEDEQLGKLLAAALKAWTTLLNYQQREKARWGKLGEPSAADALIVRDLENALAAILPPVPEGKGHPTVRQNLYDYDPDSDGFH